MDSVTQGLIGAAAAQAVLGRRLGRWAGGIGFVAGLLPDADVVFRAASDPMRYYEMHRGFTHSLAFIPVGGVLAALPFLLSPRLRARWREVLAAGVLGYATHGLLDAATAYGTQLYWPFSHHRVALAWISVVDALFSLALVAGVVVSAVKQRPGAARVALAFCVAYLGAGALQQQRALAAQAEVIEARGHRAVDRHASPAPLSVLVWRSLYRTPDGTIHIDAIRPGLGAPTVREGLAVPSFDSEVGDLIARAQQPARMKEDLTTYRWFTGGWWARIPSEPAHVGDVRVSTDVGGYAPIWGISLEPQDEVPVRAESYDRAFEPGDYLRAIAGTNDAYRALP